MNKSSIKLAAHLYEAQETLRTFYGEKYREVLTPFLDHMNSEMQRRGCSELQASITLCRRLDGIKEDVAMPKLILLALAVEMVEGIFALPAISSVIKYRVTKSGHVVEGEAKVCQHLTAENAPGLHMRPAERMIFVRGCDHGRMHGQHFIVKQSEVVA